MMLDRTVYNCFRYIWYSSQPELDINFFKLSKGLKDTRIIINQNGGHRAWPIFYTELSTLSHNLYL